MPALSNALQLTLANDVAEIGRAADAVEAFGDRNNLPEGLMHDVQVCLDEILSNIIKYGFNDGARHEIGLRLAVMDERIVIDVTDDARPFDPLAAPPPKIPDDPRKRVPGGLGIYFVRRLASELSYQREGALNRLVVKLDIHNRQ